MAALIFILLPDHRLRVRGETWESCGLFFRGWRDAGTWRAWGRGALAGAAACALIFPLFAAAFAGFVKLLPLAPEGVARLLAPYALPPHFQLRLPDRFALLVLNQLLVVALPEELFYRGWMQTSWARAAPGPARRVLGADLRRGFLATQVLFAAGHLVSLQPWRIGTFFPGLLFGWLRERSGGLAAPVVAHALSNLFIATLEASFFGGG